jgi:hypothetical protein
MLMVRCIPSVVRIPWAGAALEHPGNTVQYAVPGVVPEPGFVAQGFQYKVLAVAVGRRYRNYSEGYYCLDTPGSWLEVKRARVAVYYVQASLVPANMG